MIVVGGESLIDLIAYPGGRLTAIPGGGPFNTARTIGRLGGSAAYLGRLSTDRFGRALLDRLILDGVDCRLVQSTDDPTTLAVAELDDAGAATYQFYVEGTSAPGLSADGLADGLPAGTTALHVGTLGLVLEPMGTTLETLVRGVPDDVVVMVDPNCRPSATPDPAALRARVQRLALRADVIKASHDDLAFLYPGAAADAGGSGAARGRAVGDSGHRRRQGRPDRRPGRGDRFAGPARRRRRHGRGGRCVRWRVPRLMDRAGPGAGRACGSTSASGRRWSSRSGSRARRAAGPAQSHRPRRRWPQPE